jgi:hypothetical protein
MKSLAAASSLLLLLCAITRLSEADSVIPATDVEELTTENIQKSNIQLYLSRMSDRTEVTLTLPEEHFGPESSVFLLCGGSVLGLAYRPAIAVPEKRRQVYFVISDSLVKDCTLELYPSSRAYFKYRLHLNPFHQKSLKTQFNQTNARGVEPAAGATGGPAAQP